MQTELKKATPPNCTPAEREAWDTLWASKPYSEFTSEDLKVYYGPAYNHCRLKFCGCHPYAAYIKSERIIVSPKCYCKDRHKLLMQRSSSPPKKAAEKKEREVKEQPMEAEDEEGEEKVYIVDRIVAHRRTRGVLEFRVRWEGYRVSDDTWEPTEHFNDPSIIKQYWRSLRRKRVDDSDRDEDEEYTPRLQRSRRSNL